MAEARRIPSRRDQGGVALITALLVVALATIAAVSLSATHQIDLRRAATSQAFNQSLHHGASLEALAAEAGARLVAEPELARALIEEGCESPPLSLELDGARVEARLADLHCRLNLNNLLDPEDTETAEAFIRLVEGLAGEHPEMGMDPEAFIEALRQWADPEAETDWYQRRDPPYLPGGRPLTSASEMLLVRGVDPADYHALRPYITVLPETGTSINTVAVPERLRAAYRLPEPEAMETDAVGIGPYLQLATTLERNGTVLRRCTHFHAPGGEVVMRRLHPC